MSSLLDKLYYLVERLIGKYQKLKSGELQFYCPKCNHYKKKLQVNLNRNSKQFGFYHCWVCDFKGRTLFQLFKKLNATKEQWSELRDIVGETSYNRTSVKNTQVQTVELPKEYQPLWNGGRGPEFENAKKYMFRRGITQEDLLKYNIGYCTSGLYTNRVIIPSYDNNSQLNFFVGRDIFDSKMKYRNSPSPKNIIGFDLLINWDEPICLVEGVFDVIAIKRNAIPLFGKTILSKLKRKIIEKKVKTIYISLDTDAIKDSLKMVDEFMRNGIDVYFVELSQKDPSDLGFTKMVDILKSTKKMKFSDLMRYKLNGKKPRRLETLR